MTDEHLIGGGLIVFGLIFLFQSDRLSVTLFGCFVVLMGGIMFAFTSRAER